MTRLVPLLLLIALVGCDSQGPGDGPGSTPGPTPNPNPSEATPLVRGNAFPTDVAVAFGAQAKNRYGTDIVFPPQPGERNDAEAAFFATSLWLSGTQDGRGRYVGATNAFPAGYGPCPDRYTASRQRFALSADVEYELGEWPVENGAPVTADGKPRVYGDRMEWIDLCAGPDRNVADDDWMLRDVRVNHAVFMHDGLGRTRFVRYEVTNLSDAPITDLRAGLYSDPDVTSNSGGNLLGGTDRYAYAYVSPTQVGSYDGSFGSVGAVGILEFPKGAPLAARRIEYRNAGPGASASSGRVPYTEAGFGAFVDAPLFGMRGLDDFGDPIVDPTTGAATTFMYGGDPVAGTGWLDGTLPGGADGWDLRVLQPTEPFSLAPGETVVLTGVVLATIDDDLASGLADIEARFSAIAADPSLWRFPIAGQ